MYERRIEDNYPGQTEIVWEILETWNVYRRENPQVEPVHHGVARFDAQELRAMSEAEAILTLKSVCKALRTFRADRGTARAVGYVPSGVTGSGSETRWNREFS